MLKIDGLALGKHTEDLAKALIFEIFFVTLDKNQPRIVSQKILLLQFGKETHKYKVQAFKQFLQFRNKIQSSFF